MDELSGQGAASERSCVDCGRALFGAVTYCPFCGERRAPTQLAGPAALLATSDDGARSLTLTGVHREVSAPAPPDQAELAASQQTALSPKAPPIPAKTPTAADQSSAPQGGTVIPTKATRPGSGIRWLAPVLLAGSALAGWQLFLRPDPPDTCLQALSAATSSMQSNQLEQAKSHALTAVAHCAQERQESARIVLREIETAQVAEANCGNGLRLADSLVAEGKLKLAKQSLDAQAEPCVKGAEAAALQRRIESAKSAASDKVESARAQLSMGALDEARLLTEAAGRLDRDNIAVATLRKDIESKSRTQTAAAATPSRQTAAPTLPPLQSPVPATPVLQTAAPTLAPAPQPTLVPAPMAQAQQSAATTLIPSIQKTCFATPAEARARIASWSVPPSIDAMLQAAGRDDWPAVDNQARLIAAAAASLGRGDPAATKAAILRGTAFLSKGDCSSAIDAFRAGAAANPGNAGAARYACGMAIDFGSYAEAVSTCLAPIALDPIDSEDWASLARAIGRPDHPGLPTLTEQALRLLGHWGGGGKGGSNTQRLFARLSDPSFSPEFRKLANRVYGDLNRIPPPTVQSITAQWDLQGFTARLRRSCFATPSAAPARVVSWSVPSPVDALLQAAGRDDWPAVDNQARLIAAAAASIGRGDPATAKAMIERGNVLLRMGDCSGAVDLFRTATAADLLGTRNLACNMTREIGSYEEAVNACLAATTLESDKMYIWFNLTRALGRPDQTGLPAFTEQALRLQAHFSQSLEDAARNLAYLEDKYFDPEFRKIVAKVRADLVRIPQAIAVGSAQTSPSGQQAVQPSTRLNEAGASSRSQQPGQPLATGAATGGSGQTTAVPRP